MCANRDESSIVFSSSTLRWTASPEPISAGRVARLVSELSNLRAVDIVSEQGSEEDLAALELSPPNTTLTVFGEAPEAAAGGEAPALPVLAEIHLGKVEGSEWIAYGGDLQIRYVDGIAVRIKARVPLGIDGCTDAARWMGFSRPRNAIVRGPRCTWAGAHLSNRLEKGYGGEWEADTRWFRAWIVDGDDVARRYS